MTKRTSVFDLVLPPRDSATPASRWFYEAIRAEILAGRLRPGARLPATRDLASRYTLSRGTIVSAFDQLTAEGYIEGSVGSGTYVNPVLPDELLEAHVESCTRPAPENPKRRIAPFAKTLEPPRPFDGRRPRAFRTDLPAVDLFPIAQWAQLTARRQRRATVSLLLGCDAIGYAPLRSAIADYLTTSRGVRCTAEQVVIVSGVQEALDLAARVLLQRGDRVCVEDPGYGGAATIFRSSGAKVVPVPVDDEGIELRPRLLKGARLVYVTPAHQFPLGSTMSLCRRLELLEWAREAGAMIFEDDYDSEYRYSGKPVPALQGLDPNGIVLFAGTFSKVMFPSLRLAYLVVPPDLVPRFAASISLIRRHAPAFDQAVLCDFLNEGHFARHLRRMRQIYGERLTHLMETARKQLSGFLELSPIEAGLQTVGWLAPGFDPDAVAAAAAKRDVDVMSLTCFSRRPLKRAGLQLGFAAVDESEITRGVRELASVFAS
ncbi:MAG TPA: PLP-dependent aminotransferase family protein [Thermoanaerobaculia bacterium]|jgi:GntR family transcriptional regulator/MocR family aminotransferase